MSDEEKVERAFAPGWFQKASERVHEETKNWPEWKRHVDLQPAPVQTGEYPTPAPVVTEQN